MICKPCREAGDTRVIIEAGEPMGISPMGYANLVNMHKNCNIPGRGCACQHKVPKVGIQWGKS